MHASQKVADAFAAAQQGLFKCFFPRVVDVSGESAFALPRFGPFRHSAS